MQGAKKEPALAAKLSPLTESRLSGGGAFIASGRRHSSDRKTACSPGALCVISVLRFALAEPNAKQMGAETSQ